jgi:Bacterial regulatory protein, Fis family
MPIVRYRKRSRTEVAEALVQCRGVITTTAARLGITRETLRSYIAEDETLREARREGERVFLDSARSAIIEAVEVNRDARIALQVLERLDKAVWGRSVEVTAVEQKPPRPYCIQRIYRGPPGNELDPNDPNRYGPRYLMPWATPEQCREFEEEGHRQEAERRAWDADHSRAVAEDLRPDSPDLDRRS